MTAGMTDQRLAEAALAEIVELHRFFVDWFTGHCPKNRAGFARVADALAPGFVQVDPAGRERRRGPLLTALRAAHGSRAGEPFAIRIVRPKIRLVRRGLAGRLAASAGDLDRALKPAGVVGQFDFRSGSGQ